MLRTSMPEQGSEEWLKMRKGMLSASKIPIMLGLSPYKTAFQLWQEELGLVEPKKSSKAMEEGLACEDAAREFFFNEIGIHVKPAVIIDPEDNRFMASLDGMSDDRKTILEIKRNNKDFHELCKKDLQGPLKFHYAQIQMQMSCTGLPYSWYLSYRKGDEILRRVDRNDVFIQFLKDGAIKFKHCVDNFIPPELTDRDIITRFDPEWEQAAEEYRAILSSLNYLENRADLLRKNLISLSDDQSSQGFGLKITKYVKQGSIQYKDIPQLRDIDLNQYRSKPTVCWRVTETEK